MDRTYAKKDEQDGGVYLAAYDTVQEVIAMTWENPFDCVEIWKDGQVGIVTYLTWWEI